MADWDVVSQTPATPQPPPQGQGNGPPAPEDDQWSVVNTAPADQGNPYDQWSVANTKPAPTSSAAGAFTRSAGEAAVPTAAGLEAAIPGAEAGATVGGAAAGPAGAVVGGLVGGVGAAMGAGYLVSKGQDWVLDKLGLREHLGLDTAQRQADTEQHPIATTAGSFLPALISMRPDAAATIGARVTSGAVMGGLNAAQQEVQTGNVSPGEVAANVAAGVALPSFRKPSSVIADALLQRTAGKSPIPQPRTQLPTAGKSPIPQPRTQLPTAGKSPIPQPRTQLPTAGKSPIPQPRTQLPTAGKSPIPQPRTQLPTDPVKPNIGGKTEIPNADSPDIEPAQDVTTTAPGIAMENPPAPEIAGAGNPPDAAGNNTSPMLARVAAEPSDPGRDYRKNGPPAAEGVTTVPSTDGVTLSDNPIHEDMAAALAPGEGEIPPFLQRTETGLAHPGPMEGAPPTPQPAPQPAPQEQLPIQTGLAEARPPQPAAQPQEVPRDQIDLDHPAVKQAMQAAMRRPIVETPMPSIANSSRNMRGPVVVDPSVPPEFRRPLAVHETVEQTLMAQNMPYDQAHDIATQAEKQAVEAAGMDWNKYSEWFNDNSKHIEAQDVNPQSYANLDLHVNPEEAIGHHTDKIGPSGDISPNNGVSTNAETPVTAAVKPAELSDADKMNVNAIRAQLLHPDLKGALDKFDALSPQEQAEAANRGLAAHAEEQTAAKEASYRDKLETGVQTGGGARAQRKSGALAAIKDAVTKFASDQEYPIPTSKADKANLIERLTNMVNHAKEKFGSDPLNRTTGYQPRVKPPEWQLLKAASRAVDKPTPANIKAYVAAEKLLSTGDTGAAKDLQDTDRIDADKNLRQLPTNASSQEAMIAKAKEGEQVARIDFPPFDNSSGDESKVYEAQQNKLRTWLNGLDDVDYRLLANRHPDLAQNIETVQDPEKLHTILDGDLEGLQKHKPGKLTPVDAEEVPGKTIPVASAEAIKKLAPTEPGAAASAGTSRKDLIAEYNAKLASGELKPNSGRPADRLEAEEAAAKAVTDTRTIPPDAINGTWGAVAAKAKEFGADEVGGGGGPSMSWLTGKWRDYWDPAATKADREYGEALDDRLHVLSQKGIRDSVWLRANALQTDEHTPREWQDAYRAVEKGDRSTLPQTMQDELREHFDPIMAKLDAVYEDYKEKRPDLNLPDLSEGYIPRMRKGTEIDPTEDQTDVLMNIRRGLSGDAPNLKDREFFEAVTPGGLRTVFQPEPGGIRIYVNGKSKHYDVPHLGTETNDPNYVGKQFQLGKQQYTVDHAWANNINTHVRDENNKPLQYIESPILTASNAYKAIKTARDNWDMLQSIISSKEFADYSTRDSAEGREKGYEEITLPDKAFRGMWAAKPIARVLNDYSRPGFTFDSNDVIRGWNRALTKMIFSTPFPHALNETQLWGMQRGFNWLPGNNNYGRLMRTAFRAMKSVNDQDYIQDQLASSGASPMLGGVLTRQNMAQIAEHMGLEVQRDAPRFDPLFKTMGVSAKDVVNYWYKNVAQKPMWWWSDFLLTQQFLEHQELGQSMQGAARQSHQFISDYRVPTAALPGTLPDSVGRLISQAMTDNSVTMFGRYRYGLYRSVGNMAKNMISPNATKQERVQAVGNLLAMAALGAGVWPLISKGIQAVTGNPKAELNPAGLLRELDTIQGNAGQGAEKDLGSIVKGVFQPAPLITAGTDLANNKDWKGDPIVVRGQTFTPRGAGQLGEFAARQVAPYNTAAQAYETAQHERSGLGGTLGHVAATQLGVKLPSAKQQAYELKLKGTNAKLEKQRLKKPGGPIERGINYLTQ